MSMSRAEISAILHDLYYDSKSGYGGIDSLVRSVRKSGYYIPTRKIKDWLKLQDSYTLHNPVRIRFKRNRIIVNKIDDQWQADLVEMQDKSKENKGYRYILTCIDVFSKYAWALPLKSKTGEAVTKAFKQMIKKGRKPLYLQTDNGAEFYNNKVQRFLKTNGIYHFSTYNETKASVVERFNRTLKSKMYRYFTAKNTRRYIHVLKNLVDNYNQSYHRSIKMSPLDVNKSNEKKVYHNLYPPEKQIHTLRFKEGDSVRISKLKGAFQKGYLPGWSDEIFTVYKIVKKNPIVYKLKDYHNEILKGNFYREELQKVTRKKADYYYQIEKIVSKKGKGRKRMYKVKWRGWPSSFNSWVLKDDLKRL